MKHILHSKFTKPMAIVLTLLVAIFFPLVADLSLSDTSFLILMLLYMYWASAWNIMGGYTGLFSMGIGVFVGVGGYITACLFTYANISPWIGIIIAGLVTGVFAIIIGYPTFKIHGIFYSLASFAILSCMKLIFTNNQTLFGVYIGGSDGFKVSLSNVSAANMQFTSKLPFYYIILTLLIIIIFCSWLLSVTRRGYYFRAVSANAEAAGSLGINVTSLKIQAQFISAFFAAIGGGFYAMYMSYLDPSKLFGSDISVNVMLMVIVGGSNTLLGPIIGAAVMYYINQWTVSNLSSYPGMANVIFGAVMMIVVFFIPHGVYPTIKAKVLDLHHKTRRKDVDEK